MGWDGSHEHMFVYTSPLGRRLPPPNDQLGPFHEVLRIMTRDMLQVEYEDTNGPCDENGCYLALETTVKLADVYGEQGRTRRLVVHDGAVVPLTYIYNSYVR